MRGRRAFEGLGAAAAAAAVLRLFLSPETVRTHVQKAMRRLEADTRTQAVALALRQSLIG